MSLSGSWADVRASVGAGGGDGGADGRRRLALVGLHHVGQVGRLRQVLHVGLVERASFAQAELEQERRRRLRLGRLRADLIVLCAQNGTV